MRIFNEKKGMLIMKHDYEEQIKEQCHGCQFLHQF